MIPSLKIAKLFGINVFIHWTFWLLPLWVIITYHNSPHMMPLWMNLLLIAALFVCVVLHELGHALTARQFGIGTRQITLSPLGGIAQLERMSHKPWEEFCIAVAGPLVNVFLAGILGAGLFAALAINMDVLEVGSWPFALFMLFVMNVVMVIFNMIPAFPMDGGRVLRSILASSMGLLEGTRVAVTVGTVVAILMGIVGVFVFHNPWLFLIALFVIFAGRQELQGMELEEHERQADEEEDRPAIVVPPSRVVIHVWDPNRGGWTRQI